MHEEMVVMVTQAEAGVRAVLEELIAAQNAGDAKGMQAVLSQRGDSVFIGTDPGEWLTGPQVVGLMEQAGEDPAQVTVSIVDAAVHVEGDGVAWASGRGLFRAADGRERPVRLSVVLVREAGRWRVVHVHASVGLPDSDLLA
jgi:uncharacterized protein (TIGR02246 family)